MEVGDLGFNDDDDAEGTKAKKEQEETEAAATEAALLADLSSKNTPESDIPEDPLFASFKEYQKCAEFSVADMQMLRVVPLRPIR